MYTNTRSVLAGSGITVCVCPPQRVRTAAA